MGTKVIDVSDLIGTKLSQLDKIELTDDRHHQAVDDVCKLMKSQAEMISAESDRDDKESRRNMDEELRLCELDIRKSQAENDRMEKLLEIVGTAAGTIGYIALIVVVLGVEQEGAVTTKSLAVLQKMGGLLLKK